MHQAVTAHVTPYIGELAAHGIGSWTTPVGLVENLTEFCTVSLNGSWIAGIVAVTLGGSCIQFCAQWIVIRH